MDKRITVSIKPDGSTTVETSGFVGESCVEATAELEANLGMIDDARELKPEYHENDPLKEIA